MADKRAEKLSAARKMLKQHQEKQKKPVSGNISPAPTISSVPFENGNSSPAHPPIPQPPPVVLQSEHLPDVSLLHEQITLQRSSIEMALGEKMVLQRSLDVVNEELSRYKSSCEELTNRLKASRSLVAKLEKECATANEARAQHNTILHRLETSLSQQRSTAETSREEADTAKAEITRLLKDKESLIADFTRLEGELAEKESQLSLANIRLQQVGAGPTQDVSSEEMSLLRKRAEAAEQQLASAQLQFEEYMSSVGQQLQETASNYEKASGEKTELEARVKALVEHVAWLERQVQPQRETNHSDNNAVPSQQEDSSQKIVQLEKEMESVKEELDKLRIEYQSSKTELELTRTELESTKIELESKRAEAESAKNEADTVKAELERLAAEVPDAQLLQAAMESDKVAATRAIAQNQQLKQQLTDLQAAYVQAQDSKMELAEQLERHKREIGTLNNELAEYIKQEVIRGGNQMNGNSSAPKLVDGCCQTTYHDLAAATGGPPENEVTPEAAALLQDKFTATMNRLAALADEKQRLEHLVIQLQSETDTIGEYIALYQTQRFKLQEKATERDRLLEAVSREKEELRSKLSEITALIPRLLGQDVPVAEEAVEAETNGDATKCDVKEEEPSTERTNDSKVSKNTAAVTADRVLSLLAEVSASGLVAADQAHALHEPCPNTFHPCGVCSGRLITV